MKKYVQHIIAVVALSAMAFLSGCASTAERPSLTKQDVITAAEIAAGIVIDNRSNVGQALKIIADARRVIATGEQVTIDGLADYIVLKALQNQGLSAGQVAALQRFIERYTRNLTLEVEQIGLSLEVLVTASEVLDAVERVALEIDRFGAPLQRSYRTAAIYPAPVDASLWGYLSDKRTRERYPLSLSDTSVDPLDSKWYPGLLWMLDNPR